MIRSRKPAVGDSNKTFPSETDYSFQFENAGRFGWVLLFELCLLVLNLYFDANNCYWLLLFVVKEGGVTFSG